MLKELPKRFSLYIPTKEISKLVQEKLFELGYEWNSGSRFHFDIIESRFPVVFIINEFSIFRTRESVITFRDYDNVEGEFFHDHPIISLHEVLERESSKKEHIFTIKLSEIIDMFKNKAAKDEGKCHCTHQ